MIWKSPWWSTHRSLCSKNCHEYLSSIQSNLQQANISNFFWFRISSHVCITASVERQKVFWSLHSAWAKPSLHSLPVNATVCQNCLASSTRGHWFSAVQFTHGADKALDNSSRWMKAAFKNEHFGICSQHVLKRHQE